MVLGRWVGCCCCFGSLVVLVRLAWLEQRSWIFCCCFDETELSWSLPFSVTGKVRCGLSRGSTASTTTSGRAESKDKKIGGGILLNECYSTFQ